MAGTSGGSPIGGLAGGFFSMLETQSEITSKSNYLSDLESSYNSDAAYEKRVGDRKLQLTTRQQDQYYDRLVSQLAQSGISFSGSVVDVMADTKVEQASERAAIVEDTNYRVDQSYKKASQARSMRNDLNMNEPWMVGSSFFAGGSKGYKQWGSM